MEDRKWTRKNAIKSQMLLKATKVRKLWKAIHSTLVKCKAQKIAFRNNICFYFIKLLVCKKYIDYKYVFESYHIGSKTK